ncbi:hypothetical protein [Streptococcus sp. CL9.43]
MSKLKLISERTDYLTVPKFCDIASVGSLNELARPTDKQKHRL